MPTTRATVITAQPSLNLKKLCRHFGHKVEARFDDQRGEIHFPFAHATLEAQDDRLLLVGQGDDDTQLERFEQVLSDHLLRFAGKEALTIAWQRDA